MRPSQTPFNRSVLFYRIAERIVPLLAILMITMPVWLSFFHPAVAAYLIMAYLLYFIYKSLKTVYFAGISFKIMQEAKKINWHEKLLQTPNHNNVHHVVMIVNCKESFEKVSKTLDKLKDQSYDAKKVVVVLAMEVLEGNDAKVRSDKLIKKYRPEFQDLFTTFHPLEEGEKIGKASNASYASKIIDKYFEDKKVDRRDVVMTVCDADSQLPHHYLSYLTYEYVRDPNRQYHFYWAPVLLYNHFWKLWLPVRIQMILSSITRLSFLSMKDDLIQISTYSASLWLLHSVGFWDVDIIPEDWHIQIQAFFAHGDKIKTIPIYLPILRDGVRAEGVINTFKSRYAQERRWAWGLTDIPYSLVRAFETPHIPLIVKIRKIAFLIEIHLLWPTSFFLLTLSASIPSLVNPTFGRTVLGFLLPKFSSFILTISSVMLIVIVYMDYHVRRQIKIKTDWKNIPLLIIQWYLLPVISFFLSSLPALDAHTRVLLGKSIDYKPTKKI